MPDAPVGSRDEPFVELTFFDRDHDESIALTRKIIAALRQLQLEPILLEDDDADSLSVKQVENLFNSWAEQKRRDDELRKLGHKP